MTPSFLKMTQKSIIFTKNDTKMRSIFKKWSNMVHEKKNLTPYDTTVYKITLLINGNILVLNVTRKK